MSSQPLEVCRNCEGTIGRIEARFNYDGHVVCARCYDILRGQAAKPTGYRETVKQSTPIALGVARGVFWVVAAFIIISLFVAIAKVAR